MKAKTVTTREIIKDALGVFAIMVTLYVGLFIPAL